jgi:hypothetical protein
MQTASLFRSYDPAAWASFFTAVLTAAAALTGLLFVAVSINLRKILPGKQDAPGAQGDESAQGEQAEGFLAARAAETLAALLLVVVTCALTLISPRPRGCSARRCWSWPGLLGIVGAVYNAWVLLVEILR